MVSIDILNLRDNVYSTLEEQLKVLTQKCYNQSKCRICIKATERYSKIFTNPRNKESKGIFENDYLMKISSHKSK